MINSIEVLKNVGLLANDLSEYREVIVRMEIPTESFSTPENRLMLSLRMGREIIENLQFGKL